MSKFDYAFMSNDDTECVVFNPEKWTKEEALEQAKFELEIDSEYTRLKIFETCIQFGFYKSSDGEVYNGWFITDMYEPVIRKKNNQVTVWCVKVLEEDLL